MNDVNHSIHRFTLMFVSCLAWLSLVSPLAGDSLSLKKVDSFEELSDQTISEDWGRKTLTERYYDNLKHAESDHFVYHYEKLASKIARRAEAIYDEIMEFMGHPEDQMGTRKSHIFVLPDHPIWKKWAVEVAELEWIGGVCRGNEFYLPGEEQNGRFDSKGMTLNHEMTHLVFNRIFPQHVPTWLNEGVAEYFGARENMSTSKFRKMMGAKKGSWELDDLIQYERGYGNLSGEALSSFYGEAAMLVDFLTEKHDKKLLVKLIHFTIDGGKLPAATTEIYDYESYDEFKEKYENYRRRF